MRGCFPGGITYSASVKNQRVMVLDRTILEFISQNRLAGLFFGLEPFQEIFHGPDYYEKCSLGQSGFQERPSRNDHRPAGINERVFLRGFPEWQTAYRKDSIFYRQIKKAEK